MKPKYSTGRSATTKIIERKAVKIAEWIESIRPESPTQTEIMQKFRISKADILRIEQVLMERQWVLIKPYPNDIRTVGTTVRYHYDPTPGWTPPEEKKEEEEVVYVPVPLEEDESDSGYPESVYFFLSPELNRMKIGWTAGAVKKRLGAVSQGAPTRIVLFGCITGKGFQYEQTLHRMFDKYHVLGEWFVATEIMCAVVRLPGFSPEPWRPEDKEVAILEEETEEVIVVKDLSWLDTGGFHLPKVTHPKKNCFGPGGRWITPDQTTRSE